MEAELPDASPLAQFLGSAYLDVTSADVEGCDGGYHRPPK
jgi:hypothetical protein